MCCRIAFPVAAFLALSAAASADVVTLRNGTTLEGIVRRGDGQVRVELEFGTITVPERDVVSVASRRTALEEYRERAQAAPEGDAEAHAALARWCLEQGLAARAREEWEKAVALDPGHAEARRRLGHRVHNGEWVTEDEYRRLRGETWVDGRWMTLADLAAREEARRRDEEAARRREEESRAQAERDAARSRIDSLEREVDRLRGDRDVYGRAVVWHSARGWPTIASGGGTFPSWCAPSWQNPRPDLEPACRGTGLFDNLPGAALSLRGGPCDSQDRRERDNACRESRPAAWNIPKGPAWNTGTAGWGGWTGR